MASTHTAIIRLSDGREVFTSYGVIVAAFIPADYEPMHWPGGNRIAGYVKTATRYSVTTSRHANQYAGKDAEIIPQDVLEALCAPVQSAPTTRGRS